MEIYIAYIWIWNIEKIRFQLKFVYSRFFIEPLNLILITVFSVDHS